MNLSPAVAKTPPNVAELALACAEYVRRSIDATLDGTPDTLPFLDEWVRQARKAPRPEVVQLLAPAIGAYFGEVVRKSFPARWHAPPDAYAHWRLEFEDCFLYFNPIGMAVEAVYLEDTEGLGAALVISEELVDELREHLERTAPVRLEDYYSLSTRFEVVDQIVHFLMVRRSGRHAHDCSPTAYQEHASQDAPAEA